MGVLELMNRGAVLGVYGEETGRGGVHIVFICIIVRGQNRFSKKSRMLGWFERILREDDRKIVLGCSKL